MYVFQNKPGTDAYYAEVQALANQVTDHMTMVDTVFKNAKQGVNMVPVFHCNHSGLYLPADLGKKWGGQYGLGLGPVPCSEVLDSQYHIDPPAITPNIRKIEQIAHPVAHNKATVDLILVNSVDAANPANQMILMKDDPEMEKRAPLLRANQLKNPAGRLQVLQAAWQQQRGAGK